MRRRKANTFHVGACDEVGREPRLRGDEIHTILPGRYEISLSPARQGRAHKVNGPT